MENAERIVFFQLLRLSIGASDVIPNFEKINWSHIFDAAKKQSLLGILFDGIQKIPSNINMEKSLLLQWMAHVQLIEKTNERLNDAVVKVSEWFEKRGFRSCVLKGQGNALLYPNGMHRSPGDIDIWVEGGDKRVISFVHTIAPRSKACYHHVEFPSYKGIEVEVHYRPSYLCCLWYNQRLQKYFAKMAGEQFLNRVLIEKHGEISIPTSGFNLVFQMTHIFAHLMNEGIGLRQLLDYYYVLQSSTLQDREEALAVIKKTGMLRFAKAIMYIMQEVFGMSSSNLMVAPSEKYGRFVLNEVLEAGNFGQYDRRYDFGHTQVGHNLQRACRDLRLLRYFPSEAMSEPLFRVWHWGWRKIHSSITMRAREMPR